MCSLFLYIRDNNNTGSISIFSFQVVSNRFQVACFTLIHTLETAIQLLHKLGQITQNVKALHSVNFMSIIDDISPTFLLINLQYQIAKPAPNCNLQSFPTRNSKQWRSHKTQHHFISVICSTSNQIIPTFPTFHQFLSLCNTIFIQPLRLQSNVRKVPSS